MLTVLARLVADAALVGILLFGSAGTLSWWRAWVLLAVLLVVRGVSAVVPVAFLVVRLEQEERFLRRKLPGYREYAARVPHRLLPGIW